MSKFLMALALCAMLSGTASAGYAERVCSEPAKPEVFRIGVSRANYKPQANDCEVIHAGDAAAIKACMLKRCITFNSGVGH